MAQRGRPKVEQGPVKKLSLRMPAALHRQLEKQAREEDRSLHSQIMALLREATSWHERDHTREGHYTPSRDEASAA